MLRVRRSIVVSAPSTTIIPDMRRDRTFAAHRTAYRQETVRVAPIGVGEGRPELAQGCVSLNCPTQNANMQHKLTTGTCCAEPVLTDLTPTFMETTRRRLRRHPTSEATVLRSFDDADEHLMRRLSDPRPVQVQAHCVARVQLVVASPQVGPQLLVADPVGGARRHGLRRSCPHPHVLRQSLPPCNARHCRRPHQAETHNTAETVRRQSPQKVHPHGACLY